MRSNSFRETIRDVVIDAVKANHLARAIFLRRLVGVATPAPVCQECHAPSDVLYLIENGPRCPKCTHMARFC